MTFKQKLLLVYCTVYQPLVVPVWTQPTLRWIRRIQSSVLQSTSRVYLVIESTVRLQLLSTAIPLDNGHSL